LCCAIEATRLRFGDVLRRVRGARRSCWSAASKAQGVVKINDRINLTSMAYSYWSTLQ
jgi:hypothetical protein